MISPEAVWWRGRARVGSPDDISPCVAAVSADSLPQEPGTPTPLAAVPARGGEAVGIHAQPGAGVASRRALVVTATAAVLATGALLPFSHQQLGSSVSFVPAMLAIVACFDMLSVYLLVGDYRDRGDPRLLMMSWAYSWSLVAMGGYALAFPGVVSAHPPLALTPSMAPYFYIAWHCGFPVLLGAAWAPWPYRWTAPTPASRRGAVSLGTIAAAVLGAAGLLAVLSALAHRLPVLIRGVDTTRMTSVTAPVAIPLVVLALGAALHGTRRRTGPERWSSVAILICLCDLSLTYFSGARYSLGWYCGRSLTLLSAAVVVMAMLAGFRRLKAQAERDAAIDALTGLSNRRSAYPELDKLISRARRAGAPLGILCLDLDLFKQVNDRYGHETGDTVLIELGRLLTSECRVGDVVARVGGEEFLILLPDTDQRGTLVIAERIRARVATMIVAPVNHPITASIGATTLHLDDFTAATMLRRADNALYDAKHAGRNRVVMSPGAFALFAAGDVARTSAAEPELTSEAIASG